MLPAGVRILVCTTRQDMRKSFDTLAAVARDFMGEEPQSGALFVFLGKSPTRIKILWFDRNGYCLLAKRLHRAVFILPKLEETKGAALRIEAEALAQLLAGIEREGRHLGRVH
jgi:transposase